MNESPPNATQEVQSASGTPPPNSDSSQDGFAASPVIAVSRRVFVSHLEIKTPDGQDRKSTRLNSSHTVIYTLSLHDALPISTEFRLVSGRVRGLPGNRR